MISGKYGGGVFCNLPDGVTCMCNYSYQHEDADFMVGEHVMLMVQRYDQEKLQMYGKIMSKWRSFVNVLDLESDLNFLTVCPPQRSHLFIR